MSPQSDEQPCDLRLFTPATCLIEYRAAAAVVAAAAQAQAQNLSHAASTAIGNNSTSQPTATIGPVPSAQQLPFIKGLGLLPRSPNTPSNQVQQHQIRDLSEQNKTRSSSGGSNVPNQLSPLSLTPISSSAGPGGAPYACPRCGNTYARPHSLNRHIRFECGKN